MEIKIHIIYLITVLDFYGFQLTVLRMPILDGNMNAPLFKAILLGFPSCTAFTGKDLADVIFTLLNDYDLQCQNIAAGFTGGSFDGQYLLLSVLRHLGTTITL